MRLLISYIILLATIMLSCSNNSNKQYILSIDSLSTTLENTVIKQLKIDSFAIVEIRKEVEDNCSNINYKNDNLNNKVIIQYNQIVSSLDQILRMNIQLKKDIANSRTQINNLLYDIKNNLVDTTLLAKYIKDEKITVNSIVDRMNYNYERVMAETSRYDSLNPLIENIIHNNN